MSQNTFFKVNFVVENQNGESIENAKVTFLFKGAPEVEFTKSSGYVQHSIPIRDSVEIKIEKKGYKTKRETINCLPERDKLFTFRLESISEPQPKVQKVISFLNIFSRFAHFFRG